MFEQFSKAVHFDHPSITTGYRIFDKGSLPASGR